MQYSWKITYPTNFFESQTFPISLSSSWNEQCPKILYPPTFGWISTWLNSPPYLSSRFSHEFQGMDFLENWTESLLETNRFITWHNSLLCCYRFLPTSSRPPLLPVARWVTLITDENIYIAPRRKLSSSCKQFLKRAIIKLKYLFRKHVSRYEHCWHNCNVSLLSSFTCI